MAAPDPAVLVLGSINQDLVACCERFPQPGETLRATAYSTAQGGKGANQARGCARQGAAASFIGCVGADPAGEALAQELAADGVEIGGLRRAAGVSTGAAIILIDAAGENQIVAATNANDQVGEPELAAMHDRLTPAAVVMLQLEVPLPVVVEAARIARRAGATVLLDPAPVLDQPLPRELIDAVDWVTPNRHEAQVLSPARQPDEPVEALLERLVRQGWRRPVVKLGAQGAAALIDGEVIKQAAFPVSAVDTVGAGDAFSAGLAVALAEGRSPRAALRWAAATGAAAVTRPGAGAGAPTRDQVSRLTA